MDPRDLEQTADQLDREALEDRREADDLIARSRDKERVAANTRSEARSLRRDQEVAAARQRDAQAELNRR